MSGGSSDGPGDQYLELIRNGPGKWMPPDGSSMRAGPFEERLSPGAIIRYQRWRNRAGLEVMNLLKEENLHHTYSGSFRLTSHQGRVLPGRDRLDQGCLQVVTRLQAGALEVRFLV